MAGLNSVRESLPWSDYVMNNVQILHGRDFGTIPVVFHCVYKFANKIMYEGCQTDHVCDLIYWRVFCHDLNELSNKIYLRFKGGLQFL